MSLYVANFIHNACHKVDPFLFGSFLKIRILVSTIIHNLKKKKSLMKAENFLGQSATYLRARTKVCGLQNEKKKKTEYEKLSNKRFQNK